MALWENAVVVSRHRGAIEAVAKHLGGTYHDGANGLAPCIHIPLIDGGDYLVPVITGNATPDDVRGKKVIGNVPLHLAAEAEVVVAIEFTGNPPRGTEYSAADMLAAGAYFRPYVVKAVWGPLPGQ